MAKFNWEIASNEIQSLRAIVGEFEDHPFVVQRVKQNVSQPAPEVTRSDIWNAHLAAQLTSQQRSGPDSPVYEFLQTKRETVSLRQCQRADDVQEFVASTLDGHGGIRFYNKIGKACARNLRLLEKDDQQSWQSLESKLSKLQETRERDPDFADSHQEREVCHFVYEDLGGEGLHRIGPKQARNLVQILGLTRYETPLDSRITGWINEHFDLPYHLSASGLSEPAFYDFHLDLVQAACREANVLPCVFDAAVFASYDPDWPEDEEYSTVF